MLCPVLVLIAVLVRLDSPGWPFYGGKRVGLDGRLFRMWKFRTMVAGAERIGPVVTARDDTRVTRVGAWLRRTKLDELPQLWNVLIGDMSFVGPRPETPEMVAVYTPEQRKLLAVRPGITGPAQIVFSPLEQAVLAVAGVEEIYREQVLAPKAALDLEYLENRTLASDFRVVFQTVRLLLPLRRSHGPSQFESEHTRGGNL